MLISALVLACSGDLIANHCCASPSALISSVTNNNVVVWRGGGMGHCGRIHAACRCYQYHCHVTLLPLIAGRRHSVSLSCRPATTDSRASAISGLSSHILRFTGPTRFIVMLSLYELLQMTVCVVLAVRCGACSVGECVANFVVVL